jgi:hypothetical protein
MSTLALTFVHQVGVQATANHARLQHMQSDYLAQSAANHAMWRLLNDPGFAPAPGQYAMHAMAGGRYGYKVRKPGATTMATIATVGTREDAAAQQSYVPYIIPSNIIATYGRAAAPLPEYRRIVGAGFSDPADTLSVGATAAYWVDVEGCPLRRELILAAINDLGMITMAVWDGADWGNATTLGANGDRNFKCFDIAYESQSGRALAVGRHDATTTAYFNIWDGTSWIHPTSQPAFDIAGGAIRTVTMASCPGNDHILIATVSWNNVLELFYWNGTTFTNLGIIETSMDSDDFGAIQLVYERQSGDALLIWASRGNVRYRIWDGVDLGPEAIVPQFTDDVFFLRAAGDPNSDQLMVVGVDKFYDITVALWDGDNWVDGREIETGAANNLYSSLDVTWEATGQDAVAAWAPWGQTYVRAFSWTKDTALSAGTIHTGPDLQQQPWLVELQPVSQSEKIVLLGMTNTEVLRYSLWTGDQFKGDPAIVLASDITVQNDRAFDLAEADVPITGGTGTGSLTSNQPPVVDAGPDQTLAWPSYHIQLDGSASDDGLPTPPGAVTTQWSLVSGPPAVGFGDASDMDTMAKIEAEGTYVFRLTADDGELTAHDDVTISIVTPQILMAYGSEHFYIDMAGGITAITPQSSPKYKQFDGTTWSANALVTDIDPRVTEWMALEAASTRREMVMGTLQSDNSLHLAVWDGTAWGHPLQFSSAADGVSKCYDIAYESQSGDAVVVGRHGIASTLWYTIWNGTSWVHDPPIAAINVNGDVIDLVVAASNPLNNEILVAVIDGSQDLRLYKWDGNGFSHLGLLTDVANTKEDGTVSIVYEQQSGHALIIYSVGNTTAAQYRMWDGISLSPQYSLPDFGETVRIIRAAADPSSDTIFMAALDARNYIHAAVWDGNNWIDHRQVETAATAATRRCFDVAWMPAGSGVLFGWGAIGRNTLSYLHWPKNTVLADATVRTGPDFNNTIQLLRLLPLRAYGSILAVGVNEINGAYYTLWNGAGFSPDPGGFLAIMQNDAIPQFDLAESVVATGGGGSIDAAPPTPDPMTWASPPAAVDSSSITMTATTASDASGVQYYFECTTGGCHDSGWQTGATYVDSGLTSGTSYVYRVKARDTSDNQNETGWSIEAKASTTSSAMYVADIAMAYRSSSKKYYAQATVRIKSAGGADLEGAVVSGEWSGAVSSTSMGVTDANGQVLLESPLIKSGLTATFTVSGVVKTGYVYTQGMNVETSDSITMP